MRKPIVLIAVTSILLALAACHLSRQATNAAAERLFVMALNTIFRVASSDRLPAPGVKPRPHCEMPSAQNRSEVCSKADPAPLVVKARKQSPVVAF